MDYGGFKDGGREYLIENVATPSPWINYLYNERYFTFISNNGGGMSYLKSPLHGRITRYRINDVPPDRPGKYIYIRDRSTGSLWSLTWQPVGREREKYRVAHGFGYTRTECEIEGIESEAVFFVPVDSDQEIWRTRLVNLSEAKRDLSLYGYVELCLGHGHVDLINQCDDQHFNRVFFDSGLNTLFATKRYWVTRHAGTQQQENQEWDQWAFFTASDSATQFETLRERFIGPFRNEGKPLALESGELSCRDTDFGNAVGVLRVDVTLEPGESKELVFCLGVIPKKEFDPQKEIAPRKHLDPGKSALALEKVREKWDEYLHGFQATTPDHEVNPLLNYWTPYQAKVAFDVGRVASFYYWGISRGFGFRDTAQDTQAITASDPERARERIRLLARQMFSSGKVFHHFTSDGRGETTKHCDDPFWFIPAVTGYIKETGDVSVLEREEPFLDGKSGTIMEHMLAAARLAGKELGEHGLPRFGRGDWNDTLDYIGGVEGGESVWGGMFYAAMLKELIDLLSHVKKNGSLQEMEQLRRNLESAVNEHCWEGDRFIRAFGAGGRKIGSRESKAGKIFLNAQTWAVIAGIADRERLVCCMDSAREHLDTEFGPKICAPAYKEIDPEVGLITRCVAGKKENGAVFCHPVTWAVMAECLLGRGIRAYEYYKKTLPGSIDQDTFVAEPYVYSQYITSDEHSSPGRASHSWQTGTAAWMKKVVWEYMLGIRPTYEGLIVDPVIPSHWERFEANRTFRGTMHTIEVQNPQGVESGVSSIQVNGQKIEGCLLPMTEEKTCRVRVVMGGGHCT